MRTFRHGKSRTKNFSEMKNTNENLQRNEILLNLRTCACVLAVKKRIKNFSELKQF